MSHLGPLWTLVFSQAPNSFRTHYARLPTNLRNSFLPYALSCLPLVVSSLFAPIWFLPIVVPVNAYLLYGVAKAGDSALFSLDKVSAHFAVNMPLCAFVSCWGLALAALDRRAVMLHVVSIFCLLLMMACAPAFRFNLKRAERHIPLRASFVVLGIIASIAAFSG